MTTDLNGAYFVRIVGQSHLPGVLRVRNQPEVGTRPVPRRQPPIEEALLFPLLKGASDFEAFHAGHLTTCVIVPNTRITSIESEGEFARRYPHAHRYFRRMNVRPSPGSLPLLEDRSTFKTRMAAQGAPFYAIYNVGEYTFAPYKVVWAEMESEIRAAVFSTGRLPTTGTEKVVVPDHKVFFLPCHSRQEAHYMCALLNSETVGRFVNSFTVKIQVGTLFRHLRLPRFEPSNHGHVTLARLSLLAHKLGINRYLQERIDEVAQAVL